MKEYTRYTPMTRGWLMATLAIVMALAWCGAAGAQTNARISGTVIDLDGKPYPGIIVTMTDISTHQTLVAKTDKDGKFVQLGLKGGIWSLNFKDPAKPEVVHTQEYQVDIDKDNQIIMNFKTLVEEYKKEHPVENTDAKAFATMKQHFQAGLDAMTAYNQDHAKLAATTAADKAALAQKMVAECQTAATEFGEAAKLIGPKDTKNPPVIIGDEAAALECAEKYPEAADAFQKAIALTPNAGFYAAHATDLTKAAVAQPGVTDAQLDDVLAKASSDCTQAATLDPTKAGLCWRNVGIVLYNKGKMKQATTPFQKATAADPTYPDAWYYLGSVLLNQMDSKQEGTKITYIVLPGTQEAYQKYMDLAPSGAYAAEAKSALDTIASLTGSAQSTIVTNKKKH
jgi:tetratricopeptide (TPR) repeat protein